MNSNRWPLLRWWECPIADFAVWVDERADGMLRLAEALHMRLHLWALRLAARMALRGLRRKKKEE